jgi:peptidyl-prolyl cis-trans isomerase C
LTWVWVALGAAACGADGSERPGGPSTVGTASVGGRVVSTVDGHPITLDEVKRLADKGGISVEEALHLLQSELLLMAEAERRGYQDEADVELVARKARVQALLDAEAQSVEVSEARIDEAVAGSGDRFKQPERRRSIHVLAKLKGVDDPDAWDAGRRFIESVLPRLREEGIGALRKELGGKQVDGFRVLVEDVPAASRGASYAQPYLDALFSLDAPGVVPKPVKTLFGWHAIVVEEIIPAEEKTEAEAREIVREELLLDARIEHTRELIEMLRARTPIEIADSARDLLAGIEP